MMARAARPWFRRRIAVPLERHVGWRVTRRDNRGQDTYPRRADLGALAAEFLVARRLLAAHVNVSDNGWGPLMAELTQTL